MQFLPLSFGNMQARYRGIITGSRTCQSVCLQASMQNVELLNWDGLQHCAISTFCRHAYCCESFESMFRLWSASISIVPRFGRFKTGKVRLHTSNHSFHDCILHLLFALGEGLLGAYYTTCSLELNCSLRRMLLLTCVYTIKVLQLFYQKFGIVREMVNSVEN